MAYKIYTLTCPDSKNIVYVGLTKSPLRKRLHGHMSHISTNPIKSKWFDSLKARRIEPIIEEIDCSDDKKYASLLEAYWIRQLTAWNFVLMNSDYTTKKRVFNTSSKAKIRATKRQIWRLNMYFLKKGHGSKSKLAKSANILQCELSSFLNGGSLKEEKVNRVLAAAGVKTKAV